MPDHRVRVDFHYPARTNPNEPIHFLSDPCYVFMECGDELYKYPPKQGKPEILIPQPFLEGMSEWSRYGKHGIVLWDKMRAEEGGETKEQAQMRGLTDFINWTKDMEYNIQLRHSDIRQAHGEGAIPRDDLMERTYPKESKLFKTRKRAEKELEKLKALVG